MGPLVRNMLISGLLLAGFAILGTAIVAWTEDATRERIELNQRAALLNNLHALIPPEQHDNDLYEDRIRVRAPDHLGSPYPLPVYRARRDGRPLAAILTAVAPDGYSGPIRLLVAVNYDGTLAGVRVLNHRETPGLGDAIEVSRSDWIHEFEGKSLRNPPPEDWRVKRDGGVFDQFTGATITPRAVVGAARRTLVYFQAHREELFAKAEPDTDTDS